jgi:hypothetical protein
MSKKKEPLPSRTSPPTEAAQRDTEGLAYDTFLAWLRRAPKGTAWTFYVASLTVAYQLGRIAPPWSEVRAIFGFSDSATLACVPKVFSLPSNCTVEYHEDFENTSEAQLQQDWKRNPYDDVGEVRLGDGFNGKGTALVMSRKVSGGNSAHTFVQRQLPQSWEDSKIYFEGQVKWDKILVDTQPKKEPHFGGQVHLVHDQVTEAHKTTKCTQWGCFLSNQLIKTESGKWEAFQCEWIIPPGAKEPTIRIGIQGATGSISFDSLSVQRCPR